MAESIDPKQFQQRVLEGTGHTKTITLSAADGAELEDVKMNVVSKQMLTKTIEAMPSQVFDAVEEEDEDISAEEAERIAQQSGGATVNEAMYTAFEDLCKAALNHDGLTDVQMGLIIEEFAFEIVFELGSEILTHSLENSGNVTGFREQK